MLSESELSVLSNLGSIDNQKPTVGELAERLGWSPSHASRVTTKLADRALVRVEKSGNVRTVVLTNAAPVETFLDLTKNFPHVDFPPLISGSALRILYHLNEYRTATKLAEVSDVSRATVYRRLNSLQRVGVVTKEHSTYSVTDSFAALPTFAREIVHNDHRQAATSVANDVTIIWENIDEYLFGCRSEVVDDQMYETGARVFERYGLPLLTRERRHYIHSGSLKEVTPAELVCHTLLINDGSRYRSYCLLLIAKENIALETLANSAQRYDSGQQIDLRETLEELNMYLETEGESRDDTLPRWEDFKKLAADYDVSL